MSATGSASAGAREDASRPAARAPILTPPRVISTGTMAYPGDAFRFTVRRQDLGAALSVVGTEGTVALRVLVLADGTVREVDAVESSGAGVLDRSAIEAVRGWQFAPATRDGAPIDAYVTLRIRYVVR
ncbi:MAG TPA: energy transducer TonB [bacterium]|nr:energy transducer TonB [bacterium]